MEFLLTSHTYCSNKEPEIVDTMYLPYICTLPLNPHYSNLKKNTYNEVKKNIKNTKEIKGKMITYK